MAEEKAEAPERLEKSQDECELGDDVAAAVSGGTDDAVREHVYRELQNEPVAKPVQPVLQQFNTHHPL